VVYSPNGNYLITSGADKAVAIRDPASSKIGRVLRGPTNRVNRIAVSPDSQLVAGAGGDGTVRVWSINDGEPVAMFSAWNEKFAAARSVAFSPDGVTLASGADDGTIKFWNVAEQKENRKLEEQSLPVTGLTFFKNGACLASSTGDWRNNRVPGEIRLWNVTDGADIGRLKGNNAEIKCLAIDNQGKFLASTSSDRFVRVWRLDDRSELWTTQVDVLSGSLTFSPDGKKLAMGQYSGAITLWDVASGTLVQRYSGHTKGIPGIAFCPDGKQFATVSTDGTLGLWPILGDMNSPIK